jgi:hypothetical protein
MRPFWPDLAANGLIQRPSGRKISTARRATPVGGGKVAVGKRPLMSPALIDHLEIATSPLSSAPNAGPGPPHGVVNS